MQEKTFTAVQKAEAEDEVPDERKGGYDSYIVEKTPPGTASRSLGDDDLGPQRAVSVHVLDIALNGGIGMVDKIVLECVKCSVEGDGFVYGTFGEARRWSKVGGMTAEETQLGVRIVAAVTHPSLEKEVAPANHVSVSGRLTSQESSNLLLKLKCQLFVGIEGKNPRASAFLDSGVLLAGEALPLFEKDLGIKVLCDLDGAVGRTGVDDDDLIRELHAGEGAREIYFFVERNDRYRKCLPGLSVYRLSF